MIILKTVKLSKIYPGAIDVVALDSVDFTMDKGDLTAIIGDSGSGKSTLLHMLAGVDSPTDGKIFIQGEDITDLSREDMTIFRRRNIGVIYQFFNLLPSISVRKNILLPLLLDGHREEKNYFREVIETLGIADKLDRFPNQLSGGEQQRVAIARSLVTRPAIVLADEPTGNLDRKNSEEITGLFRLVNQRFNSTIMIITHNEKVAISCDNTYKMIDGKLYNLESESHENH